MNDTKFNTMFDVSSDHWKSGSPGAAGVRWVPRLPWKRQDGDRQRFTHRPSWSEPPAEQHRWNSFKIHCIFYENSQHFIGPIPEFHDNDPQSLVTCTSDQNWTAGSFQQAGPVWPPCWEGADSPLSNWSPARVGEQRCLCSSHTAEGVSVILLSRYESSTLTFPLPRHPQYPPKIQREPWCTTGKIWLPSSSLSAPAWPGRPEILQVGDSWSFTNITQKLIQLIHWYSMPACSFIFFRGGFITQTHGSCHGGEVDAIQMEVVFKFSSTELNHTWQN